MKSAVSPAKGRTVPSSAAAVSSRRRDVVPTATMRPPAARAALSGGGGIGGDLAPFGVHAVLGGVVGLDGQEGAGADVQRDEMAGDAPRVQGLQQRRA